MNESESEAWRPKIPGWSIDILPFYERMATQLGAGAQVVEIGVYFGRSLLFLAEQLLVREKRNCKLWAVDLWEADWSFDVPTMTFTNDERHIYEIPDARPIDGLRSIFKHARGNELQLIHPIRATSRRAAQLFADGEIDLVFIDACHDYAAVAEDIATWLPKVRPGGIIAGHDYNREVWPGVVQAVDEAFANWPIAVAVAGSVWMTKVTRTP